MSERARQVVVRSTRPEDFPAIAELSRKIYPGEDPWTAPYLASQARMFPEGQFVATGGASGRLVGMAASLIVCWDDHEMRDSYQDFTGGGRFTNHDPESGRTLYGAEIMVDPDAQGMGVGKLLYGARRDLCRRLGLERIRAGARIPGYGDVGDDISAVSYVIEVVRGERTDPTLTFQLKQGFRVLAVVRNYARGDSESRGYGVVIEWINDEVATPESYAHRDPRFEPPPGLWPTG